MVLPMMAPPCSSQNGATSVPPPPKLTLKGALPLITICVSSLCLSFVLSNDHFIPHILLKLEIRLRNANVNKISVIDKASQAPSL